MNALVRLGASTDDLLTAAQREPAMTAAAFAALVATPDPTPIPLSSGAAPIPPGTAAALDMTTVEAVLPAEERRWCPAPGSRCVVVDATEHSLDPSASGRLPAVTEYLRSRGPATLS
ncbi:MAG: hypothetical protein R2698_12005 [Microthrixaceae bacterium]